jgi:hypothetical protein
MPFRWDSFCHRPDGVGVICIYQAFCRFFGKDSPFSASTQRFSHFRPCPLCPEATATFHYAAQCHPYTSFLSYIVVPHTRVHGSSGLHFERSTNRLLASFIFVNTTRAVAQRHQAASNLHIQHQAGCPPLLSALDTSAYDTAPFRMLPDAQLLTIPTTFSSYKPKYSSSTTKSVAAPQLFLLQVNLSSPQEEKGYMAHQNHRSSRSPTENELWFNMPASRPQQEQNLRLEQSAYQSTSHRISTYSNSSRTPSGIPSISTTSDLNKPLPPSPSETEQRSRKPVSLRGFLRGEYSSHRDNTHLRPEPYQQNQRQTTSLNVDTNSHHHHSYSRSMPSSPYNYSQSSHSQNPATFPRAHSAASDYPDTIHYQPYSLPSPQQADRPRQQRAVSMNPYFETTSPPRSRTFPEPTLSPTARDGMYSRPRPHTTWLSPTEPFTDVSQFHLFAEAMTGLPPGDSEPFSPTAAPQLQGSLFARSSAHDAIPLPLHNFHNSSRTQTTRWPQREQRDDWQNFEPPPLISARSAPAPNYMLPIPNQPLDLSEPWQPLPHMSSVTAELEMLGLDDPQGSDDELPDYQTSQAEMAAKKRREASARARELEARWRGTRGR